MTRKTNKSRPGRLRIVAGNWRSRLLDIADLPGLRPTSERIRETLFNWLSPHIDGAHCLDLCAGTGALGLEAMSRGAARAVFVESSRKAADVLRRNIATLGAQGATVIESDACEYLMKGPDDCFDIVFIDPPFDADMHEDLCRLLDEARVLGPNARVYLEEDRDKPEASLPGGWRVIRSKNAGNVRYSLVEPGTGG